MKNNQKINKQMKLTMSSAEHKPFKALIPAYIL